MAPFFKCAFELSLPSADPKQRVGWDVIEAKFRDCVSFAAKPLISKNIDRVIALVRDLENQRDVTEIVRLLI